MKKIIFILMALIMVFSVSNADSNSDIFNAKTAKHLSKSNNREYYLVKTHSGDYSDLKGNFKYILFTAKGYKGRFNYLIKQYSDNNKIEVYYMLFQKISIPKSLINKGKEDGYIKKVENAHLIYSSKFKKVEKITFFSGDE